MTRHLLEHVIEERDSRCDSHRLVIEIDCDLDRGLARPAVDQADVAASPAAARPLPRFPRRCPGDGRAARRAPGSQRAPGPCRDRRSRSLRYDRSSAPPGNPQQSDPWLAAVATVRRMVRAEELRIEADTLGFEQRTQESLRLAEAGLRERRRAEPSWLLTSTTKAGVAKLDESRYHTRHQLELRQAVDLLVVGSSISVPSRSMNRMRSPFMRPPARRAAARSARVCPRSA